jgi:hypothetical protein
VAPLAVAVILYFKVKKSGIFAYLAGLF